MPDTEVIVYDLGLTAQQVKQIESYCNVKEVRPFQFDRYPKHTKMLFKYAWKPFIIKEMVDEYELFFYCDASCRMKGSLISLLPNLIKQYPILPLSVYKTDAHQIHSRRNDPLPYAK